MSTYDLSNFDALTTYSAAALDYDYACGRYWAFSSLRAVELAAVDAGMTVLDAGCGTGAATLPAATRVGPRGRVVAVDFLPEMLALASEKASQRALINIDWRLEDMTALDLPAGRFEAVLCVMGLSGVAEMPGLVALFWRLLRPGGRLVIVTVGRHHFDPLTGLFLAAARAERADLEPPQPWLRANTVAQMRAIFQDAGVPGATIAEETVTVDLAAPEDWWRIVRGTGLSRTAHLLGRDAAARVEAANLRAIADQAIHTLTTSFLYTVAQK